MGWSFANDGGVPNTTGRPRGLSIANASSYDNVSLETTDRGLEQEHSFPHCLADHGIYAYASSPAEGTKTSWARTSEMKWMPR